MLEDHYLEIIDNLAYPTKKWRTALMEAIKKDFSKYHFYDWKEIVDAIRDQICLPCATDIEFYILEGVVTKDMNEFLKEGE